MRREMSMMKKQLEDVQQKPQTIIGASTPHHAPTTMPTTLQTIQTVQPSMEDAVAEEYVDPAPVHENLNLNELSRQMLEKALERNNGVRKKAAKELGISDRTLYRWLKQYGIE